MQHVHVELLRILQERKVHFGFRQQAAVRDMRRHELGILAFDRLVVVAINDPGRNGDRVQLGITV